MTSEEANEYHATKLRVAFGCGLKKSPDAILRETLDKRMEEHKCPPFIPLRVDVEEFTKVLFSNPNINRIHSISLDALECLPYRPDMAFDRWWAAFEVLLHEFDRKVWNKEGSPKPTVDLFGRFCKEVLLPEINDDSSLDKALDGWMGIIPDSVCRYAAARILIDREIKVASQYSFVRERAKQILGKELYDAFEKEYVTVEDDKPKLDGHNHHRAARKLYRVLTGQPLTFQSKGVKGIERVKAWEFVLSCILYASRCERLHGDYFSPFYSAKAKYSLYAHWYWMAETVYFMFNLLLKRRLNYIDPNPITSQIIVNNISTQTGIFNKILV